MGRSRGLFGWVLEVTHGCNVPPLWSRSIRGTEGLPLSWWQGTHLPSRRKRRSITEHSPWYCHARGSDRAIRWYGEEGGTPQSRVHPTLWEWSNALSAPVTIWYYSRRGRSSGNRILFLDLCHTSRSLLQRWFLFQSIRHCAWRRSCCSTGNRYV